MKSYGQNSRVESYSKLLLIVFGAFLTNAVLCVRADQAVWLGGSNWHECGNWCGPRFPSTNPCYPVYQPLRPNLPLDSVVFGRDATFACGLRQAEATISFSANPEMWSLSVADSNLITFALSPAFTMAIHGGGEGAFFAIDEGGSATFLGGDVKVPNSSVGVRKGSLILNGARLSALALHLTESSFRATSGASATVPLGLRATGSQIVIDSASLTSSFLVMDVGGKLEVKNRARANFVGGSNFGQSSAGGVIDVQISDGSTLELFADAPTAPEIIFFRKSSFAISSGGTLSTRGTLRAGETGVGQFGTTNVISITGTGSSWVHEGNVRFADGGATDDGGRKARLEIFAGARAQVDGSLYFGGTEPHQPFAQLRAGGLSSEVLIREDLSLGNSEIELNPAEMGSAFAVKGKVTLSGVLKLWLTGPPGGGSIKLVDNQGPHPVAGIFRDLPQGTVISASRLDEPAEVRLRIDYTGGDGNEVVLHVENSAPVAGADNATRPADADSIKIPIATLLANDTDAENDALTITAVGGATPAGATVQISGNFVIYAVPLTTSGNGGFVYTLSDGTGGHVADGIVTITETPGPVPDAPPATAELDGDNVILRFFGVPGRPYRVQFTASASLPIVWREFEPAASFIAPATGVITHVDLAPTDEMRMYRLIPD